MARESVGKASRSSDVDFAVLAKPDTQQKKRKLLPERRLGECSPLR